MSKIVGLFSGLRKFLKKHIKWQLFSKDKSDDKFERIISIGENYDGVFTETYLDFEQSGNRYRLKVSSYHYGSCEYKVLSVRDIPKNMTLESFADFVATNYGDFYSMYSNDHKYLRNCRNELCNNEILLESFKQISKYD